MAYETIARRSDKNAVDLVDHVHYSPTQIARLVGLSATTICKMMDAGTFPRSHGVTPRRGVWGRQVRAYLEQQALAPDHGHGDTQSSIVGDEPSHPTDQKSPDTQSIGVGGVATSGTTTSQSRPDAHVCGAGGRPVFAALDVCPHVREDNEGTS